MLEIRLCGGLEVLRDDEPVSDAPLAGKQGRLAFAYLVANRARVVGRDELADLLWAERLPESWSASLSAVVSRVRKQLSEVGLDGTETLANAGDGYQLALPSDVVVDWEAALTAIDAAETSLVAGDTTAALDAAAAAARIAGRGFLADAAEWVDRQRSAAKDVCVRAALVAADAHLANGQHGRAVEAARQAVSLDELREAGYRLLMRALEASGERAQALRAYERCRVLLADELGVDPSPETEAVYVGILGGASEPAPAPAPSLPSGVVTFLLTDIVESSALWEQQPAAMAAALERHDALVGEVVAAAGGTLLKSKLEGDATVSVFTRATGGALAAIALRAAIASEEWPEGAAPTVRMALHTGEAFERAGDYFGPALNRAARIRGLAGAGQILLSQAVAELVRDHLPDESVLVDLGHHELRGLSRGENVYAVVDAADAPLPALAPLEQPALPATLAMAGPFVGRGDELASLWSRWSAVTEVGGAHAMLIAGEPGVGKSRLAAECARLAHADGGIVLYGRCDEDLGAALQPFVEAIRGLTPALGRERLRRVRGVHELARLVPEINDQISGGAAASSADPDTERQALFDAIAELLAVASKDAPLVLVLDDVHWAGKTTLSLLRHLLRNAGAARLLVLATYRDTELGRTHPLAATIADLRRDRVADRVSLEGLDAVEVAAYLAAVGNNDAALSRELAEVTSGNPFFLIEALRHVEESGGVWEPGSLPEGVREATGRRLSHLSDAANDALSVAAVAGTTFELGLIERVRNADLVDEISEAVHAGLIVEDPAALGTFRFAHALVRQVLLTELVTLKRLRLHQTIAELLEADGDTSDARLADLAYHWFECASAGNAAKAVDACRRAADNALERLAYEEAGDLYRMAAEAAESIDANAEAAELHLAQCDVLLTAGDVPAARAAIAALAAAVGDDGRLRAWHTTYSGELAVLTDTEALPRQVDAVAAAATTLHAAGDITGEAKAHYVHALALERLGEIGAAERALVAAIDAARTAGNQRLADAILAETPPVVLWGPIPVTRASGRCLDVVRVLRITSGAPAVESVALRCQAVLEALRGRIDAARRMIASAFRKADEVGLVLRRLETETSAGYIELIAGDADEAERILRAAYDELRTRSLDSEAALAAALLARALLLSQRDHEAEVMAKEAEGLAGADLHPAVWCRDSRALAAIRRNELDLARELAQQSLELVASTDALLLVVDARRTMAAVLSAAGDLAGAAAQDRLAIEAAEAKGATVLVEGSARSAAAQPAPESSQASPWANAATHGSGELIATRGERLALFRSEGLVLVEVDDSGEEATRRFELDDIATAYAALNDAFVAQDARNAQFLRTEDFNRRDWDAFASAFVADVRVVDNRPLRFLDATNADELVARYKASVDVAPDSQIALDHLVVTRGSDGDVALMSLRMRGSSEDAPFEKDTLLISRADAFGRATMLEYFDVSDLTAARARYAQIAATFTASTPEVRWGNSAWQALPRALRDVLDNEVDYDTALIATRGEDLALALVTAPSALPDTAPAPRFLAIVESAPDGSAQSHTFFDADALTEAYASLDDRFVARDARNAILLAPNLFNDRAWDAFTAAISDEIQIADHRPARLLDGRDRAELVAWQQAVLEFAPDARLVIDHLRSAWISDSAAACVAWLRLVGTTGGAPFETPTLLVARAEGATVVALDYFDELDYADALARYEQLVAAAPVQDRWGNAAWEAIIRFTEAWRDRDWERVCRNMSRAIDDRTSMGGISITGDKAVQSLKWIFDAASTWTSELVATRGELLVLHEVTLTGGADAGAPFETLTYLVTEVDEHGAQTESVIFGSDALDEAFDELDRRYKARGGVRAGAGFLHAMNAGDWDKVRSLVTAEWRLVDHRPIGFGSLSGENIEAFGRATEDLAESTIRTAHIRQRGDVVLYGISTSGSFRGGSSFENLGICVAAGTPLHTTEVFDESQVEEALALFDRLAPATPPEVTREDGSPIETVLFDPDALDAAFDELDRRYEQPGKRQLANLATRNTATQRDAILAKDWDAIVATHATDFVIEDRRGHASFHQAGVEFMRSFVDIDIRQLDTEILAIRGDRLALSRTVMTFSIGATGESVVESYGVLEVDDAGRRTRLVAFEVAQLDAAFDELDALYVAQGGPDLAVFRRDYARRDLDALTAEFLPEARVRDHRVGGWGDLSREEFVARLRATTELAADSQIYFRRDLRVTGDVWLVEDVNVGTRDGGPFELPALIVVVVSEGGAVSLDFFDVDDLASAEACFDAAVAERQP